MHTSNLVAAWALQAHDDLVESAARVGLGLRELSALTLVEQHPGCSIEWLRQRVGLSQPGTVRLVDRLAGAGVLERVPTPGRDVDLQVTTQGAARLAAWSAA